MKYPYKLKLSKKDYPVRCAWCDIVLSHDSTVLSDSYPPSNWGLFCSEGCYDHEADFAELAAINYGEHSRKRDQLRSVLRLPINDKNFLE